MADPQQDDPPTPPADPGAHPLVARLKRAIQAHPVLSDQKKLQVVERHGLVRLEGHVFTRDMLRQVHDLVARLPDGSDVLVRVESEVLPPQRRETIGRVPDVSPGPSNVNRAYSTAHLGRRRGRRR